MRGFLEFIRNWDGNPKKMSRVQKDCRAIELSMMEDSRDKEKKRKAMHRAKPDI
jgi:hypothetical protein